MDKALKRYDLVTNYRAGSSIEEMERADDGDWVRYEDVMQWLDDGCTCNGGAQGEGLVSIPHEPSCALMQCDCVNNPDKPKQHGADPHAKNCNVYVGGQSRG